LDNGEYEQQDDGDGGDHDEGVHAETITALTSRSAMVRVKSQSTYG